MEGHRGQGRTGEWQRIGEQTGKGKEEQLSSIEDGMIKQEQRRKGARLFQVDMHFCKCLL